MENKHTTDTLKTTRGENKRGDGKTPTLSQPKKQQYYISSNYRKPDKKEFLLEIISEDKENYYVKLLPEYQGDFQEKDTITPLRKQLIGENKLYMFVEKPKQMSIFDFI